MTSLLQPNFTTIRWNESSKLDWKNFKASPAQGTQEAARTYAGIRILSGPGRGDTVLLTVAADFDPDQSWVKKDLANPYLLEHEQLHFDIYELSCRKLRKTIIEHQFRKSTAQTEIQNFTIEANMQNRAYQQTYDDETKHSINATKQAEWIVKVKNEIALMRDFKDPVLKLVAK